MKYYRDITGAYLGGFSGVTPPDGAIEVAAPPASGCMLFVDGVWVDPPATPPASVTMRQARLALLDAGLLDSVNAAIAAMAGVEGDAARIEWEYAATVERGSPLVSGLAAALALTDAQLDSLFLAAAGL